MSIRYGQCRTEYSQNRLRRRLLRKLLARSSITEGDLVYDIGAGDGVITSELAGVRARVIAIERDGRLVARLRRKLGVNPLVTVRHGDFLSERLPRHSRYKVFANIPFIHTADIVRKLLLGNYPPDDCYLVMQKEAAEKFAGIPTETLFSLLLKPWFEFRIPHNFRKTDFFPVPTVDIVLLRIRRKARVSVAPEHASLYRDFIIYGYRQGKPTVESAFRGILTHVQFRRLSGELGFPQQVAPRELSFAQWLGLFRYFSREVDSDRRSLINGAGKRLRRHQSHLKKVHRTSRSRIKGTSARASETVFEVRQATDYNAGEWTSWRS